MWVLIMTMWMGTQPVQVQEVEKYNMRHDCQKAAMKNTALFADSQSGDVSVTYHCEFKR